MMITLLSPSKTLNFTDACAIPTPTVPELLSQALKIQKTLKGMTAKDLERLMKISPKLAQLNYERLQNFTSTARPRGGKAALLAYSGDVYEGFELEDYTSKEYRSAQKRLRIISGLYGLLRPLDLIQPYRLEMKTPLEIAGNQGLYQFWGSQITDLLNEHTKKARAKFIVNLASREYSKAILFDHLTAPVINIDFKEKKGKQLTIVGLLAKRARGRMANYIIRNQIDSPTVLTEYNIDGYTFSERLSEENNYIFIR